MTVFQLLVFILFYDLQISYAKGFTYIELSEGDLIGKEIEAKQESIIVKLINGDVIKNKRIKDNIFKVGNYRLFFTLVGLTAHNETRFMIRNNSISATNERSFASSLFSKIKGSNYNIEVTRNQMAINLHSFITIEYCNNPNIIISFNRIEGDHKLLILDNNIKTLKLTNNNFNETEFIISKCNINTLILINNIIDKIVCYNNQVERYLISNNTKRDGSKTEIDDNCLTGINIENTTQSTEVIPTIDPEIFDVPEIDVDDEVMVTVTPTNTVVSDIVIIVISTLLTLGIVISIIVIFFIHTRQKKRTSTYLQALVKKTNNTELL
ncbi:hypothetical protein [Carp edema virus]|nr:hypothetical protein [Carp edema virus]